MIRSITSTAMLFIMLLAPFTSSSAVGLSGDIALLQHEWARIKYQTSENLQEAQFEALAKTAETITAPGPDQRVVWAHCRW